MEPQFLKNLATNKPQSVVPLDKNAPFSFIDWKARRPAVNEKDALFHYNRYVIEWFENNQEKKNSQTFLLRQKYLYLLNQLQLFFTEEEKDVWYRTINVADDNEILLSIPYFARKLKDISLYYLKLRKSLQHTKLKYNTVGTATALEREIGSLILESFTSLNKELKSSLQTTLPAFSSIQQDLTVVVEEVYDDKVYFDQSSTLPVSSYYNLFDKSTEEFFSSKGISLSSSEWLFNSLDTTNDVQAFVDSLTAEIFETTDANLYGSFIQKFLAENKYTLTFNPVSATTDITNIEIEEGNNYFLYPYGLNDTSLSFTKQIKPVSLSSLQIENATAGESYETSDTIFIKNGDTVKGAWLRKRDYDTSTKTVKASFKQNKTTKFIFPFPGYGLSALNIPWTGPSLETTNNYEFLPQEYKTEVDKAYWTQTLPEDSCEEVYLNNTSLLSGGTISNINPRLADQVYLQETRSDNLNSLVGNVDGAWLYKFTRTSIPVAATQQNIILWPYGIVDTNNPISNIYKQFSYQQVCDTVPVQSLDRSFSVASSAFELADKIYRINNYTNEPQNALECAWLSGRNFALSGFNFLQQDGFSALFESGQATRFIWTGLETPLANVFKQTKHQLDCPFLTQENTLSAFDWQRCACKQVYHSPLGHPGRVYNDYNQMADFVVEEPQPTIDAFDIGSWRDSLGRQIYNSSSFAWYKTQSKNSWGGGQWVNGFSQGQSPFTLKPGKSYVFYRANTKNEETNFPPYSVNFSYGTSNTRWIEAKLNTNGEWSSTNKNSLLNIQPGDFLIYDRQGSTTQYLLSTQFTEVRSQKVSSIWSTYDYVVVEPNPSALNSTFISWPTQEQPLGVSDPQYPSTSYANISTVDLWKITLTTTSPQSSLFISNARSFVFTPQVTGTYTVAVTARKTDGSYIQLSSQIPAITAVNRFQPQTIFREIKTPTSGFLIEKVLTGWDYGTNTPRANVTGARPYWAELYTNRDANNKYKGTYSWGYPSDYIDGYLPNHTPRLSPLQFKYGSVIEYVPKGYTFTWNQPIRYKTFVGQPLWCELSANTNYFSNLSSLYISQSRPDLLVFASNNPTNILLSNILNGRPVEVYYNALNTFTWPISVETILDIEDPTQSLYFNSPSPWANIPNRFFSGIANVPVLEEIYTEGDVGGYFTPQQLGASFLINKDFVSSLKNKNLSGTYLTEDTNVHIGGRGNTKQDQDSLYDWSEDNQWLKEPITSGALAGAVKKSNTQTLQTFIPYETTKQETTPGLVTPTSRVSPWGGVTGEDWTDILNEPKTFTGVRNVSAWVESQVLKQNKQTLYDWVTDVYGNQYGLFKNLPLSGSTLQGQEQTGEVWVRKNNQFVSPAAVALSGVYKPFVNDSLLYNQLTGQGIKTIDCFFEVLLTQTPTSVIYSQLEYDYDNAEIFSTIDATVKIDTTDFYRFEDTWFLPEEKRIISLYTVLSSFNFQRVFIPSLYELNLNNQQFKQVFPLKEDAFAIQAALSSLNIQQVNTGSIYFNSTIKKYVVTYTCFDAENNFAIINFEIDRRNDLELNKIDIYSEAYTQSLTGTPPSCTCSSTILTADIGEYFSVDISNLFSPGVTFKSLSTVEGVDITSSGTVYGTISAFNFYNFNFDVCNETGCSQCVIGLNVKPTENILIAQIQPSPDTPPGAGYQRWEACLRNAVVTVDSEGIIESSSYDATTNNLNLTQVLVDNNLIPQVAGTYSYSFVFYGWRKWNPQGWISADDKYDIYAQFPVDGLLS